MAMQTFLESPRIGYFEPDSSIRFPVDRDYVFIYDKIVSFIFKGQSISGTTYIHLYNVRRDPSGIGIEAEDDTRDLAIWRSTLKVDSVII